MIQAIVLALLWAGPVDFELPDIAGRNRSLREWREQPVVVVAFLGTQCPVARRYAERLAQLQRSYGPRGFAIVGVFADPADDVKMITELRDQLDLPFPL